MDSFFLTFIFDEGGGGEGQTEREGDPESEAGSGFWAVSTEPDAGLELTDCESWTWPEVGGLTHCTTQAPPKLILREM